MNLNSCMSIVLSKTAIKVSKILNKNGSSFPGKIALSLDKNILKTISDNYKVILITGTNGKTTTTSMIYNILQHSPYKSITNSSGANMINGIVTTFIKNYNKKNKNMYAVIEVDEANLKYVTKYIKPEIIVVTNIFRDQLDRYGEVYTTLNKIIEGIKNTPESTLVLNGDESLLGSLDIPNKVIYYGFNCDVDFNKKVDMNADAKFCIKCKHPYKYKTITYNHLGHYYCENCGYERPNLTFNVNKIKQMDESKSLVKINNEDYIINQSGVYNIYNALCAYSVANLLGFSNEDIYKALKEQKSHFGRQEEIDIDGVKTKIILVKNPAGCNEAINAITLDKNAFNIAIFLNDNYADGKDVSWIWDAHFEKLKNCNIDKILISGRRLYDMGIRLKTVDFDEEKFLLFPKFEDILEMIKKLDKPTYILATYTAMIDFRKLLKQKKYINKMWD